MHMLLFHSGGSTILADIKFGGSLYEGCNPLESVAIATDYLDEFACFLMKIL